MCVFWREGGRVEMSKKKEKHNTRKKRITVGKRKKKRIEKKKNRKNEKERQRLSCFFCVFVLAVLVFISNLGKAQKTTTKSAQSCLVYAFYIVSVRRPSSLKPPRFTPLPSHKTNQTCLLSFLSFFLSSALCLRLDLVFGCWACQNLIGSSTGSTKHASRHT